MESGLSNGVAEHRLPRNVPPLFRRLGTRAGPNAYDSCVKHGGDRRSKDFSSLDSKVEKYGQPNSYLRRRLRRDKPDLYEKVSSGELTAHAAAVQAGIQRQRRSIRIDSPHAAINGLLGWFTADELRQALHDLDEDM